MSDIKNKMWRSLEERTDGPKANERFNPFNNDFLSRREFMEWTSGMVAVLGATACTRMPDQKMIPYTKQPERVIPGQPLFFATSMALNGRAIGLLVESHMGRPTKIEGNPEHPASLGTSDAYAQASVLSLYDPDRSQTFSAQGDLVYWNNFVSKLSAIVSGHAAAGGEGLRLLTETVVSPTLAAQIQELLRKYPQAQWHQYEPVNRDGEREGALLAFGEDVTAVFDFAKAKTVVSLDSDFLSDPACPRYAKDFALGRRPGSGWMNRLFAVEPSPTITGAKADHKLVARASEIEAIAGALAASCGVSVSGVPSLSAEKTKWVKAAAEDLKANSGSSIVVAGRWQSPLVHALAAAINVQLKNVGQTVKFTAPVEFSPVNQTESIQKLAADMNAGKVTSLVILGGNPVYNAPAGTHFETGLAKVKNRVHCGLYVDETGSLCNYHIPEAHYLEQWSDARAYDGTAGITQPLIAPLFGGKSHHEVVSALLGQTTSDYDSVRAHWKAKASGDFEKFWTGALNDGFVSGTASASKNVSLRSPSSWATVSSVPSEEKVEVVFRPDSSVFDGRFSNSGWLQELAKPISKLVWDNAAYISAGTAAKWNVKNGRMVRFTMGELSVDLPVWILPGHAANSVTLPLGYGRKKAGKLGSQIGFDVYPLRKNGAWQLVGADTQVLAGSYTLTSTQDHHSMENRPIVRTTSFENHQHHPHWAHLHEHVPSALEGKDLGTAGGEMAPVAPADYQWGMAINLSACTGCNACVVACQSENNIPVVGKEEVARGREMSWIRMDRYYEGDLENPQTHFQPVACVQCETAPCEIVCPVGATVHDNEGLNNMVYNRCVGTKYCSNNCPYKARRFNFYEYTKTITPTVKMVQNPNVTVRNRGVMEKCTYCVQRISSARITAKNEGRKIRDGEVRTACQSACPSQAIFFGNISDPESLVSKIKAEPQNYGLLEELNTKPRTTYLGKVTNPAPSLKAEKPA